jgi:hypothetical protein
VEDEGQDGGNVGQGKSTLGSDGYSYQSGKVGIIGCDYILLVAIAITYSCPVAITWSLSKYMCLVVLVKTKTSLLAHCSIFSGGDYDKSLSYEEASLNGDSD